MQTVAKATDARNWCCGGGGPGGAQSSSASLTDRTLGHSKQPWPVRPAQVLTSCQRLREPGMGLGLQWPRAGAWRLLLVTAAAKAGFLPRAAVQPPPPRHSPNLQALTFWMPDSRQGQKPSLGGYTEPLANKVLGATKR